MLDSTSDIPKHIAIIMDGNRRWSVGKGVKATMGYNEGVDSVVSTLSKCLDLHIEYLTLYVLSKDNMKRPESQLNVLRKLLLQYIKDNKDYILQNDIKINLLGDVESFDADCYRELNILKDSTAQAKGLNLTLAINYNFFEDLANSVNLLIKDSLLKKADDVVSIDTISNYVNYLNLPNVDLLIRTGKEKRLSGFLLWHVSYTEMIFLDKMWPEFKGEDLVLAVNEFLSRVRRYGK